MREDTNNENTDPFLESPAVQEHFALLKEIGITEHIEDLYSEIRNYKSLLSRGLDIINRTNIDEIMDSTVYQISGHVLPSFIAFLWKPIQTREDITIRAYRDNKPTDINLRVNCITPFETFFQKYPKPVNFDFLAEKIENNDAVKPYKDINTEIAIPILGPFGLYGIILVGKKVNKDAYSSEELYFLQQLMSFVSQAIKNHLHYENSLRDVKTGLYNHGFFLARLKEEVAHTRRNAYKSSIIVMDVDKFKNFNDSYGHLAGDMVLEKLAQVIKKGVRCDDVPSRFGGEEFTVLLPHTDSIGVWNVAERLRKNVAEMQVSWEVPLPQVTISVGIYTFDETNTVDVTSIIRRADEALYVSKERGRNRCTMWNSGIIDPHSNAGCSEKISSHDKGLELL